LEEVLAQLPKEHYSSLIGPLRDRLPAIIKDSDQFYMVLQALPQDRQVWFIEALGDRLPAIIKDRDQFHMVLEALPQDRRVSFIEALQRQRPLLTIIRDVYELSRVLSTLPNEDHSWLIKALRDDFPDIIGDGYQLSEVLSKVPNEDYPSLIKALRDDFPVIIKDGNQLYMVLQGLRQDRRVSFIEALRDRLPAIIKDGNQLYMVLQALPQDHRVKCMLAVSDSLLKQASATTALARLVLNYKKFIVPDHLPITQANALLNNYVNGALSGAGLFGRIVSGHWNRHHADLVKKVLAQRIESVPDLIREINQALSERYQTTIINLPETSSLKNRLELIAVIGQTTLNLVDRKRENEIAAAPPSIPKALGN
jgi:hypothetical protein